MKDWIMGMSMICLVLVVLIGLLLVAACIVGSHLARYIDGYDREFDTDYQAFMASRKKGDFK
ncbi:hypothetical protein ACXM1Q_005455 [Streptococcus sp. 10F2]